MMVAMLNDLFQTKSEVDAVRERMEISNFINGGAFFEICSSALALEAHTFSHERRSGVEFEVIELNSP